MMQMQGELLVVDEATDERDRMVSFLESCGHVVHTAASNDDCLLQISRHRPQLLLARLAAPQVNARALLSRIRNDMDIQGLDLGVVALSGEHEAGRVSELLDQGMDDFLLLPVPDMRLLDHVVRRNLMSRSRLIAQREKDEEFASLNDRLSENLRILESDQVAGSRVQRSMMPEAPFVVGNTRFNYWVKPSLILSGDFIDYFELTDGHVLFFIADVSGHGASSAFITALLKIEAKRVLRRHQRGEMHHPGDVLGWLNKELLESDLEHHVTMFMGMIDPSGKHLAYSNAAHFPAAIYNSGEETRFLEIGGLPLGLSPRASYEHRKIELPRDCSLVLFSDGIFEIMKQHSLEAKEQHLLSLVGNGHTDIDALCRGLGVLDLEDVPDDIAIFTINANTAG